MEGDFEDDGSSFLESLRLIVTCKEASVKSDDGAGTGDDEVGRQDSSFGGCDDQADELADALEQLRTGRTYTATVMDSGDEAGVEATVVEKIAVQKPKLKHQLDHAAWLQRKKEQMKKEQKEKKRECRAEKKVTDLEEQKHQRAKKQEAFRQWVVEKEREQARRQHIELQTEKQRRKWDEQRSEIARQKFAEWYNRKELERLDRPAGVEKEREFRKEAAERKKKLGYNLKWDEWYRRKKHHAVPTKFTHNDYPQPAWINPEPWVE